MYFVCFFLQVPPPLELYPLSLHDALPIFSVVNPSMPRTTKRRLLREAALGASTLVRIHHRDTEAQRRSEEHTSELQSPCNLVCRLLLEKKKKLYSYYHIRNTAILLVHRVE